MSDIEAEAALRKAEEILEESKANPNVQVLILREEAHFYRDAVIRSRDLSGKYASRMRKLEITDGEDAYSSLVSRFDRVIESGGNNVVVEFNVGDIEIICQSILASAADLGLSRDELQLSTAALREAFHRGVTK